MSSKDFNINLRDKLNNLYSLNGNLPETIVSKINNNKEKEKRNDHLNDYKTILNLSSDQIKLLELLNKRNLTLKKKETITYGIIAGEPVDKLLNEINIHDKQRQLITKSAPKLLNDMNWVNYKANQLRHRYHNPSFLEIKSKSIDINNVNVKDFIYQSKKSPIKKHVYTFGNKSIESTDKPIILNDHSVDQRTTDDNYKRNHFHQYSKQDDDNDYYNNDNKSDIDDTINLSRPSTYNSNLNKRKSNQNIMKLTSTNDDFFSDTLSVDVISTSPKSSYKGKRPNSSNLANAATLITKIKKNYIIKQKNDILDLKLQAEMLKKNQQIELESKVEMRRKVRDFKKRLLFRLKERNDPLLGSWMKRLNDDSIYNFITKYKGYTMSMDAILNILGGSLGLNSDAHIQIPTSSTYQDSYTIPTSQSNISIHSFSGIPFDDSVNSFNSDSSDFNQYWNNRNKLKNNQNYGGGFKLDKSTKSNNVDSNITLNDFDNNNNNSLPKINKSKQLNYNDYNTANSPLHRIIEDSLSVSTESTNESLKGSNDIINDNNKSNSNTTVYIRRPSTINLPNLSQRQLSMSESFYILDEPKVIMERGGISHRYHTVRKKSYSYNDLNRRNSQDVANHEHMNELSTNNTSVSNEPLLDENEFTSSIYLHQQLQSEKHMIDASNDIISDSNFGSKRNSKVYDKINMKIDVKISKKDNIKIDKPIDRQKQVIVSKLITVPDTVITKQQNKFKLDPNKPRPFVAI